MSCSIDTKENPLSNAIKPKDDQACYKQNQVFAKDHFLYLVVGRKRSGKSTLAVNLLDTSAKMGGFKKKFDKIWLISPTAKNDEKLKELVDELEGDGQFFTEFNNDIQTDLMGRIKSFNEAWDKKTKLHIIW